MVIGRVAYNRRIFLLREVALPALLCWSDLAHQLSRSLQLLVASPSPLLGRAHLLQLLLEVGVVSAALQLPASRVAVRFLARPAISLLLVGAASPLASVAPHAPPSTRGRWAGLDAVVCCRHSLFPSSCENSFEKIANNQRKKHTRNRAAFSEATSDEKTRTSRVTYFLLLRRRGMLRACALL